MTSIRTEYITISIKIFDRFRCIAYNTTHKILWKEAPKVWMQLRVDSFCLSRSQSVSLLLSRKSGFRSDIFAYWISALNSKYLSDGFEHVKRIANHITKYHAARTRDTTKERERWRKKESSSMLMWYRWPLVHYTPKLHTCWTQKHFPIVFLPLLRYQCAFCGFCEQSNCELVFASLSLSPTLSTVCILVKI